MLSRQRCASCGQRVPEKLASLYWAWFRADGVRTAWRQRLCANCTVTSLSSLLQSANSQSLDLTTCPSCGGDASEDLDPIYLTLYVPGREQQSFELTTDAPCAARIRVAAQAGAQQLQDRTQQSSGSSATSAWDALGLAPQT